MGAVSGTVYDSGGAPAVGRTVRAYRRDTGALIGEDLTSDGLPVDGDDYFDNVVLLLNMNGANGSGTFVDSSSAARAVTANGGIVHTTSKSKFGGACADFTGGGKSLTLASNAAFTLGTGDFTLEMFAWLNGSQSNSAFFDMGGNVNGSGSFALFCDGSSMRVRIDGGNDLGSYSFPSEKLNIWIHLAVVRVSGVIDVYLDGVLIISGTRSQNITQNTPNVGALGGYGFNFNGWIDSVRLTKGVARYTDDFTPPSVEFAENGDIAATPAGSYEVDCGAYTGEVQVVCLDDDAGTLENDLILRTFPV